MVQEGFKRKLTAILSADVEGYSRLMGDDEEATVRTLTAYREVLTTLIQQHNGKVLDSPGDNLLAEFVSVVDAVQCAVAVQKEINARNNQLPENRRMQFRIGINLGDVIQEAERIYGDGVNIAARLESLANPGGICISKTAFDQIESKLPYGYEFLGDQTVKNIAKPVSAYRVLMEPRVTVAGEPGEEKQTFVRRKVILAGAIAVVAMAVAVGIWHLYMRRPSVEPASVERMAFKLPDKPSIAVLPFDNLSKDQSDAYIADGLSENIISSLSMIPDLLVIARNSTFAYKGKAVKVNQVAEELGVRYVLEGSVQKSNDKIRVIAQLIDAVSGHHLWSEKYDREVKDFFQLLDEITLKIIGALSVKLIWGGDVHTVSTTSFEAWSYLVKGGRHFRRFTKQENIKARELYKKAIKIDPEYVDAWTMLGWTHFSDARNGFTDTPIESVKQAVLIAKKASGINDRYPNLQNLWASLYLIQRQHEKAIAAGQKSIELDANYADGYALLAQIMYYSGRSDEAITLMQQAMRLSPYPPAYYLFFLGWGYQGAGRYQEALSVFQKLLERAQAGEVSLLFAHNNMTTSYSLLGDYKKAREHWAEVLKIYPKASLNWVRSFHFFKDPDQLERLLDVYRAAGISEHRPLPLPDKPSIAVLAFENMSGDPEQEYFSDGLSEEIITALSKTPKLFVIARNSSFTYKGKPAKVQQIGRELGVKYVLEGSVRKAGNRVRITAQLVDAKTGKHLWADRYDRDLKDIFALQDEITMKIITALQVELTDGEQAHVVARGTENLQAYLKYLEAREYTYRFSKDGMILARKVLKEAIELDPEYGYLYLQMGWIHLHDVSWGWSKSSKKDLKLAYELAQKALALNAPKTEVYMLLSGIHLRKGDIKETIALREKAVALQPNHAFNKGLLAIALTFGGRPEEAIPIFKKAIRLDPFPPVFFTHYLGTAYRVTEQYEKAIEAFKTAISRDRDFWLSHWALAVCYGLLGREDESRASAAEVFRIRPNFSLAKTSGFPYKDNADKERCLEVWKKAGLK